MTRQAVATLALFAILLALPTMAAADETMCGVRGSADHDALLTAMPVFGMFSLTPASEMSTARAPLDTERGGPLARDGVLDTSEILWCVSPDDPRCAPANSGSGNAAELLFGGTLFVLPSAAPPIAGTPVTSLRDHSERARVRRGVARSLDRPPR